MHTYTNAVSPSFALSLCLFVYTHIHKHTLTHTHIHTHTRARAHTHTTYKHQPPVQNGETLPSPKQSENLPRINDDSKVYYKTTTNRGQRCDSENSWISDGLPSSSRRRRRGGGRWEGGINRDHFARELIECSQRTYLVAMGYKISGLSLTYNSRCIDGICSLCLRYSYI